MGIFDFLKKKALPEQFIIAAKKGNVALVKKLLEKGADVNAVNKDGETALMWASDKGHTEVAKLLIEKGADVNVADKSGTTALIWASLAGHTEIVKLLKTVTSAKEEKTVTSAKEEKPAINSYPPYTAGTGACDVCNRPLSGVKAYIVPNSVFYSSPKWRAHFRKVNFMLTDTDAYIESMRIRDRSQGSAVCENCIHMF
jgi:hypothetical protein